MRGIFVTGTDTGVGKTVVSAALMHRFRGVRYWKPIQTGIEQDDDTAEVVRLGGCEPAEVLHAGVRLPRPLSPHLAARLNGTSIDIKTLVTSVQKETATGRWVVEGAGGALVPVNASDQMVDLMMALGLPVLVVARTRLGTINHTLLTLEALVARAIHVAGVVMVGAPDEENRRAIEQYGSVRVVGELPILVPLTSAALGQWAASQLDPDNRLGIGE